MKLVQPSLVFVVDSDKQLKMNQMWECSRCEKRRQWGFGPSLEPNERPYLYCKCLDRHVPHKFAGLKAA